MYFIQQLMLKLFRPIYSFFYRSFNSWLARNRKQRSIDALYKLDDYLLDDVGLRRQGDDIVPIDSAVQGGIIRNHRRKVRLRCAFLVRRRQRRRRRVASV